jgi:hypothetical protein
MEWNNMNNQDKGIKPTEQDSTIEDESHLEVTRKAIEDSALSIEEKESTYKLLKTKEGKILVGGLLTAGLLSYSAPSKASNSIVGAITSAMQDMFVVIMGAAFDGVNQKVEETSKETQTAMGVLGDSINTTMTVIEENKLSAAVMSPPDFCRSDEIGKKSTEKASQSRSNIATLNIKSTNEKILGKIKGTRVEDVAKSIQAEYGPDSDKYNQHLDPTGITTELSIKDSDGEKKARAYIETLQTPLKDTPNIPTPENGEELTTAQLRLKARLDSRICRIKMAEQPLLKSLSERRDDDGESKMALLEADVQRTYGDNGDGWRKELGQYSNPTPNTQESAKQIAFNNKLAYETLKEEEMSCNMQAVILLELLDDPMKAQLLSGLSQVVKS